MIALRSPRLTGVLTVALLVAGVTTGLTSPATAGTDRPERSNAGATNAGATVDGTTYDGFIVHFAPGSAASAADSVAAAEVRAVARGSGRDLRMSRRISTGGVLVQVKARLDKAGADQVVAAFLRRSGVAYAEVDAPMTATLSPDDTHYPKQWDYFEPVGGMNLPAAWDRATGAGVTVAVLDTGITEHPDLDANVGGGYDFVSNAAAARDGDGRDPSPADQGDWYARNECGKGVPPSNSSWHGTHVSGTIAAVTGNGLGVSGVAFGATVQPVRVLAKCGGTLSDIADAITWASGGTVSGVPANPDPAEIINMSLGGSGKCGATYQSAINGAVSRGTTVVVAAGNSNANAASFQPASCANVVVVAASDREGNRASYSNYGSLIDVAAPGGETATAANGIASTLNTGTTVPGAPAYVYYQGTSMAAPHVAGLAALLLSTGTYSPSQVEAAVKAGARPLVGTCKGGCGAGLADAARTVPLP